MKLYKKLLDVEKFNEKISGSDNHQAQIITKQFKENWNLYKELYEYNTNIVADLFIREENGELKELKQISYKDFRKNYDNYAAATCFYEELNFLTNNIWESIW